METKLNSQSKFCRLKRTHIHFTEQSELSVGFLNPFDISEVLSKTSLLHEICNGIRKGITQFSRNIIKR
jgi:hypothetical protein